MDSSRFDEIVASFYEAASGRQPWRSALDALAAGLDSSACVLAGFDPQARHAAFRWDAGRLGGRRRMPAAAFALLNDPVAAALLDGDIGQWLHATGQPPADSALAPGGCRVATGALLLAEPHESILFALCRGVRQRTLNADELVLIERIGLHLSSALRIYRAHRPSTIDTATGLELLRSSGHPVILIDDQLRIHYCNSQADKLLQASRHVHEHHGRLACRRPADDHQLLQALSGLELNSPRPPGRPRERAIVRIGQPEKDASVIFATANRSPAICEAVGRIAVATLLFHQPGLATRPDPALIAEAFDLTPAEAGVAAWLASGMSADQIAAERDVSTQTIRAQIRAVFEKTGINRQADLIRLLVEMPGSHDAQDDAWCDETPDPAQTDN